MVIAIGKTIHGKMNVLQSFRDWFGCCGADSTSSITFVQLDSPREDPLAANNGGDDCCDGNCQQAVGLRKEVGRLREELERRDDKLWSAVENLRRCQKKNDKDIDKILQRVDSVSYSPNYVTEERETFAGIIYGDAEGHETRNENLSRQVITASTTSTNSKSDECYAMNNKNRNKCIIFSHQFFKYKSLSIRECADEEVKLIKDTFEKLNFEIVIYKDCTYHEINKILKKLSEDNYENDDCICIFLLTHGTEGVVWAKDACYPIDIFEETLSKIRTLVNKPKFIIFQTCRGESIDRGINLNQSDDESDFVENHNKIPSRADFLIVHSTVQGFVSWRQWFIPALCKMLNDFSEVYDIETILMKTTEVVCRYESENNNIKKKRAKQVPCRSSTLRKKVYLKRRVNS